MAIGMNDCGYCVVLLRRILKPESGNACCSLVADWWAAIFPRKPLLNRMAVNQLCSVVASDAVSHTPLPHILPAALPRRPASAPDMRQLERHQLQQDMLRIELGWGKVVTLNEGRAVNRQYSCCFSVIMAVAGLLVFAGAWTYCDLWHLWALISGCDR